MRIVADENIHAVHETFGPDGELQTLPGRAIDRHALRGVDALLVRSVTPVRATLLDGTPVRFVGSATAGIDHIDSAFLASRGIALAHAPGCNATAVAEYVGAALLALAGERGLELERQTLGVVGVGHVGSKVARLARVLGMDVVENDPPLSDATGDARLRPVDELLARAGIVTLHVPLMREGAYPTNQMVDAAWLNRLRLGAILINTSRGDVIDETALKAARRGGHVAAMVLDVWRGEPRIDRELLELSDLATPHIAGYSVEARQAATRMIHDAFCRWAARLSNNLGVAASGPLPGTQRRVGVGFDRADGPLLRQAPGLAGSLAPPARRGGPPNNAHPPDRRATAAAEQWRVRVRQVFDIAEASRRFKNAMAAAPNDGGLFDQCRQAHVGRRELAEWLTWSVAAVDSTRPIP